MRKGQEAPGCPEPIRTSITDPATARKFRFGPMLAWRAVRAPHREHPRAAVPA